MCCSEASAIVEAKVARDGVPSVSFGSRRNRDAHRSLAPNPRRLAEQTLALVEVGEHPLDTAGAV